jgi:hypothetical protein
MKALNLAILLIISTTCPCWATPKPKEFKLFKQVAEWLNSSMIRCPNKVWPGYNFRRVNVLLGADGQAPMLWRGTTGRLESITATQVPKDTFAGMYGFPPFDGDSTISFFVNKDMQDNFIAPPQATLKFTVHEAFHHFFQAMWIWGNEKERGTPYPVSFVPRLYRRLVFDHLKSYAASGAETEELAKAAYWYEKWKTNFPDEYAVNVDRKEGTARYVEDLVDVIAKRGCDASDKEIMTDLLESNRGEFALEHTFALDMEGYVLGAMAGNILQFLQRDPDWQMQVAQGPSTLELLFANVTPQPEEIPAKMVAKYRQMGKEKNKKNGKLVDADIAMFKSPNAIRISTTDSSMKSEVYNTIGELHPLSLPDITAVTMAGDVEFGGSGWKLKLLPYKVAFVGINNNPCTGRWVTADWLKNVKIRNGVLKVKDKGLKGSIRGTLKVDDEGRPWFCEEQKNSH